MLPASAGQLCAAREHIPGLETLIAKLEASLRKRGCSVTAHRAVVLWQRSKQARTTWHDDTKDGAQWSAIVSLAGGVTQLEVAG